MRVIGLTGGVGAGKSRILNILKEEYGAEVFVTDEVAHELMEPGRPGYEAVVRTFGGGFLNRDGSVDKKKLADLIFHDEEKLKIMNSIIHPMVWKTIEEKISASHSALIVVESAIMDKKQGGPYDELWYVYTSEENRVRRLMENRGYTEEHSRSIMKNQYSDEQFRSICDRVIDNNGTVEEVRAALKAILKDRGKV